MTSLTYDNRQPTWIKVDKDQPGPELVGVDELQAPPLQLGLAADRDELVEVHAAQVDGQVAGQGVHAVEGLVPSVAAREENFLKLYRIFIIIFHFDFITISLKLRSLIPFIKTFHLIFKTSIF